MAPFRVAFAAVVGVTIALVAGPFPGHAAVVTQIIDASGDGAGDALSSPGGLGVDAVGNVYVAGFYSDNVFRIAPDGVITEIIGPSGDGAGHGVHLPEEVATDGAGRVYVTSSNTDYVFRIDPDGTIRSILGPDGDGAGNALSYPVPVAVDGAGNVYVGGYFSDNVFRITPAGVVTTVINSSGDGFYPFGGPSALALDGAGNLYVSEQAYDNIFRITPAGAITRIAGNEGDGTHEMHLPEDLALDGAGNLYVSAQGSDNAFRITPGGTVTQIVDSSGDGLHPLYRAFAVATDADDNVYVTSLPGTGGSVFRIDPSGLIAQIIDETGDGAGHRLSTPSDVLVDGAGHIYVTSTDTSSVFRIECPCVVPMTGSLTGRWLIQPTGGGATFLEDWTQSGRDLTVRDAGSGAVTGTGVVTLIGQFRVNGPDYCNGFNCCPSYVLNGQATADATAWEGTEEYIVVRPAGYGCITMGTQQLTATRCGGGLIEPDEQCDDGNRIAGDGCDPSCRIEPCFTCAGEPSTCTPTGIGSPCDDGNPCTSGEVCTSSGCTGSALPDDTPCEDGNPCTQGGRCVGGSCVGNTPVVCPDDDPDPCRTAACDPASGACVPMNAADGTACDDGNACTANDVCTSGRCRGGATVTCAPCLACDPGDGCVLPAPPRGGCRPIDGGRSALRINSLPGSAHPGISWSWDLGSGGNSIQFGNPLASDDYALCLYDQSSTPTLAFRALAPAGGSCRGRECWTAGLAALLYNDPDRTPEGLARLLLKRTRGGGVKATVKGGGPSLVGRTFGLPTPPLAFPLLVQLQSEGGTCLEASYGRTGILRNETGRFKAKAP